MRIWDRCPPSLHFFPSLPSFSSLLSLVAGLNRYHQACLAPAIPRKRAASAPANHLARGPVAQESAYWDGDRFARRHIPPTAVPSLVPFAAGSRLQDLGTASARAQCAGPPAAVVGRDLETAASVALRSIKPVVRSRLCSSLFLITLIEPLKRTSAFKDYHTRHLTSLTSYHYQSSPWLPPPSSRRSSLSSAPASTSSNPASLA